MGYREAHSDTPTVIQGVTIGAIAMITVNGKKIASDNVKAGVIVIPRATNSAWAAAQLGRLASSSWTDGTGTTTLVLNEDAINNLASVAYLVDTHA